MQENWTHDEQFEAMKEAMNVPGMTDEEFYNTYMQSTQGGSSDSLSTTKITLTNGNVYTFTYDYNTGERSFTPEHEKQQEGV